MYRILTEDTNESLLTKIVSKYFSGFNMLRGLGCWHGIPEKSAIFEIVTDNATAVQDAANDIRTENNQQSVLVQDISSVDTFVGETNDTSL